MPAAGADRQFDIFGNPIAPRPATAAASTPAPRGAAAPPRGPGAAAGAPSAHESARSPDTRFATVQARASADGRRLFGHHAPVQPPPLPEPARQAPTAAAAASAPAPAAAPARAAAAHASRPVLADHPLAPLSAAAAQTGPFAGRCVGEPYFKVGYLDRHLVRAEYRPALSRWLDDAPAPAPLRQSSRVILPAAGPAAGAAVAAAGAGARLPAAGQRAAAGMSSQAVAGGRSGERGSARSAGRAAGPRSSMAGIMNWGSS